MGAGSLFSPAGFLYFLAVAFGNAFAFTFFLGRYLEPRVRRFFPLLAFTGLLLALALFYDAVPAPVRNISSDALTIALALLVYRDGVVRKLIVVVAAHVLLVLVDLLLVGIGSAAGVPFGQISLSGNVLYGLVLNCVVANALLIPLSYACEPLLKSRLSLRGRARRDLLLAVSAVFVPSVLLGSLAALAVFYDEALACALSAAGLVLMTASLILFDRMFRRWLAAQKAEAREALLRQECALEEKSRVQARRYREEVAALRAGMDGMLGKISALLKNGDPASALDCVRRDLAGVQEIKRPKRYQNSVADYFLAEFESRCAAERIALSADVSVPEKTGVDDLDFCTVLSNVLDNAVNACRTVSGSRYIRLSLHKNGGVLFLGCENSKSETEDRGGKNRRRHFGLRNIRETAEKYGGEVRIDDRPEAFSIRVLLYCGG
jgi:signal transduction histidine kinase